MSKNVLIADDSATIRKLVTLSLKSMGAKVTAAADGMDALEKLPSVEVDLIITDLNMPNVDGYELIRSVRENSVYDDVPIIILTSEKEQADINKGMDAGANSYLIKPFVSKKLQYEVSKYLG